MHTPIVDFLKKYQKDNKVRFHVPGQKGKGPLGCEALDITEVKGADSLYEADGIIAESEQNAASLFGSQRTCYSTEGSSQCVRAMLYLAINNRPGDGSRPLIVAARNVHKSFVHAAALLDFDIEWLWPEHSRSLCDCRISSSTLESVLKRLPYPPAAVYLTSPDYLGGMADIQTMAELCHRYGTILIVDNAHGAYLRFLSPSQHPLDFGADLCCDSAHKTLPVLTGGAYLHVSRRLDAKYAFQAKSALEIFGSTSPSYLTLASLDYCNALLDGEYPALIAEQVLRMEAFKTYLRQKQWQIEDSDPLRLTIGIPKELGGIEFAQRLCRDGIECEYAEPSFAVFMTTPENNADDLQRLATVLGENLFLTLLPDIRMLTPPRKALSVRQALFSPHETVPAKKALNRICGLPAVSCPPAVPIVMPGEQINAEALQLFHYYGIQNVSVLKQKK